MLENKYVCYCNFRLYYLLLTAKHSCVSSFVIQKLYFACKEMARLKKTKAQGT